VYDPELTLSTPARVSAETGMNAIAHGVEVAYSPRRTPESEAVALACVARGVAALPRVVADPGDIEARTEMLAAASLGGRCLQNGTVGVHHGLAQLLGGRTGISHGLANAIVLPHAVRFNAEFVSPALSAALGDPAALVAQLGLPARLSEAGVTEDDLDAVAHMSQDSASVRGNPRPVSEDDARAILAAAL
jgi:alcohol dehydrogenase class IV